MPTKPIPSAKEAFGFASRPLADYFQAPQDAAFDTRYSPTARKALLEDELYRRSTQSLQKDMQAEAEAENILNEAAGLTDAEIEERAISNPRILNTPQFGLIKEFAITRRDKQALNPTSDTLLGPVFAEKITDPDLKAKFQERMVQGISFEDARNQYYNEDFNRKQAVRLAEEGIPEQEYQAFQKNGLFDPVAVARRVAEERTKRSTRRGLDNPLDQKIDLFRDAVRTRTQLVEKSGGDPATDPLLLDYSRNLDDAYKARMMELSLATPAAKGAPATPAAPVPGAPAVPAAQAPAPPAPVSIQDVPTPEEAQATFQAKKQEEEAVGQIARVWTEAKKNLGSELLQKYPDKDEEYGNPAVLLASAILAGKTVKVQTPIGRAGNMVEELVPYPIYALEQIGKRLEAPAFKEPGNERWGTQDVTNAEVLEAWATDFLTAKGLLQAPGAAATQPVPTGKIKSITQIE